MHAPFSSHTDANSQFGFDYISALHFVTKSQKVECLWPRIPSHKIRCHIISAASSNQKSDEEVDRCKHHESWCKQQRSSLIIFEEGQRAGFEWEVLCLCITHFESGCFMTCVSQRMTRGRSSFMLLVTR
jgi:hypothetical protein